MAFETILIGDLEVFEFDFSNKTDDQYIDLLYIQTKLSNDRLPIKTYFLLNLKNSSTSSRVIEECKKVIMENQHTKSVTAIYNLSRFSTVLLKMLNLVNKNKTNVFMTREEAITFLIREFDNDKA
jgi:hypothetical protein